MRKVVILFVLVECNLKFYNVQYPFFILNIKLNMTRFWINYFVFVHCFNITKLLLRNTFGVITDIRTEETKCNLFNTIEDYSTDNTYTHVGIMWTRTYQRSPTSCVWCPSWFYDWNLCRRIIGKYNFSSYYFFQIINMNIKSRFLGFDLYLNLR